jgi:signal transduction histidine kinase
MDVYLDRQQRDVDRLGQLIEDLLQLSRLDQGRGEITLRPLDLNAWAASLIDEYAILASQHAQTLTLDAEPGLPPIEGDSGFLAQVLGNLLNNAMNYTQPGGIIRVTTLKRRVGQDVWVGFSVSDNGPGISPEDQERLFERFFRGRVGRAASAPGTGLGLSIAREIVSLHHGQIELESSGVPGEGTQFSIWLPAIKEKTAA